MTGAQNTAHARKQYLLGDCYSSGTGRIVILPAIKLRLFSKIKVIFRDKKVSTGLEPGTLHIGVMFITLPSGH